jgi:hypothetical protein
MNFFKIVYYASEITTITSTLTFIYNNNLKLCKIAFSLDQLKKVANFEKKQL